MDIVIVDDAPIAIALLKKLVGQLPGARPVPFTSAAEGLRWCETHDPDLVIVDYVMPEIDGIEFARRFRAMPDKTDTPLLMVTAGPPSDVASASRYPGRLNGCPIVSRFGRHAGRITPNPRPAAAVARRPS